MWLPDDAVAAAEAAVALGHTVEARGVKFKTWQKERYTNGSPDPDLKVHCFIAFCLKWLTLYLYACPEGPYINDVSGGGRVIAKF